MPKLKDVSEFQSLLEFCRTPTQYEAIQGIIECGSNQTKAAKLLGRSKTSITQSLAQVRGYSVNRGWSPPDWTHPVPEGHRVKGVSTSYNADGDMTGQSVKSERDGREITGDDPLTSPETMPLGQALKGVSTLIDGEGNIRGQWVKTFSDKDNAVSAALIALADHMEQYKGAVKPTKRQPHKFDEGAATLYPWGDPHVGMLSHHLETGIDFDIKIAEEECKRAVDLLLERSSPTETGVMINVGDFFHAENDKQQTPTGGNHLDCDSRLVKVSRIGFGLQQYAVDRMLQIHKKVVVFNAPGNHDPMISRMLNLWLEAAYSSEPRVEVVDNANPFMYWRFGCNLIGITHGDGPKPEALPLIMVNDRPQDVGETSFRLWVTGHIHHLTRKEYTGGFTVESFRTLAARDYWHHWKGYRSDRSMTSITLHEEFGELARATIGIKQIQE